MSEQLPMDFVAAAAARDRGIAQAADHASRIDDTFAERALAFLYAYARANEQFISETATDAAAVEGLTSPADRRAWGAVFQKAAKQGYIRKIGFGTSLRRHLSPTPLWASLVCAPVADRSAASG